MVVASGTVSDCHSGPSGSSGGRSSGLPVCPPVSPDCKTVKALASVGRLRCIANGIALDVKQLKFAIMRYCLLQHDDGISAQLTRLFAEFRNRFLVSTLPAHRDFVSSDIDMDRPDHVVGTIRTFVIKKLDLTVSFVRGLRRPFMLDFAAHSGEEAKRKQDEYQQP